MSFSRMVASEPSFLTLESAHEYLDRTISVSTLRWWVRTGRLAAFRPGRRLLVKRDDLLALIEKNRTPASAFAGSR